MFEVGQKVTIITEKVAYDGVILARATGDDGQRAYKIALHGGGIEQTGQWHKAADVFIQEPVDPDPDFSLESLANK
jgi:hypothetical protein